MCIFKSRLYSDQVRHRDIEIFYLKNTPKNLTHLNAENFSKRTLVAIKLSMEVPASYFPRYFPLQLFPYQIKCPALLVTCQHSKKKVIICVRLAFLWTSHLDSLKPLKGWGKTEVKSLLSSESDRKESKSPVQSGARTENVSRVPPPFSVLHLLNTSS